MNKKLTLLALTWPIFLEQLLHTIVLNIDIFMLSHYSDNAVAAVGVAGQILMVANILFGFVNVGLSILISQLIGAGKEREASNIASIALGLNMLIGVVVSLGLVVLAEPLLRLMNLPPELMGYGQSFLTIVGMGTFSVAIISTADTVLRMYGYVRQMLVLSVTVVVLNIIGNYLALFGPLGLPVLGVEGVAMATNISRFAGIGIAVYMLLKVVRVSLKSKALFSFPKNVVNQMLTIGVPSAGENMSYQASQVVITYMVTLLGTTALTTKIYTQSITTFVFLFSIAIGQATSIMVGRLIGAERSGEAYGVAFRNLRTGLLITFGTGCLLAVFSDPLLGLFTDNEEVIALGGLLMLLSLVLEAARACNVIVIGSLNAAGDVKFPVVVGLISMWAISLPLAYVFAIVLDMGITGIWLAFIADEWLRGLLMIFRWRSRKWQSIRLSLVRDG
ncbi:MATE family efflux transporter [Paenibacillus sp. J5C_2022]|uniref:MATE family efflux transporter n=1 Tax=Paenibacillus sp. J5C2022 TaxID=2977129 RepID=UPI0021CE6F50|nr:MATE family efflux transporter [Paenibacillus sp. J5C2022]MCU6710957.1 MATE family efflux transporter [Paenibacillus sp. J5C2022]